MKLKLLALAFLCVFAITQRVSAAGLVVNSYLVGAAADTTPPTLTSATIQPSGTTINYLFNESVQIGAGGNGGLTVSSLSGGAATLTYASGSGSNTLVYTLSRTVNSAETGGTTSYTQPGNGIEDIAGNDKASFSTVSITNISTQTGGGSVTPDILWWKFTDGSGGTVTSAVGPNGTLGASTAAPTWITGNSGTNHGLQFDGTNDTLQSASAIGYSTSTITVCVWVYWNSFGVADHLLMESTYSVNSNTYCYFVDPDSSTGKFTMLTELSATPSLVSTTRPSAAAWHHYAFVLSTANTTAADAGKIYIDGVLQTMTVDQASTGSGGNFATDILYVMHRNNAGSPTLFAAGRIADFRIYAGERTSTEILAIKNDPQ